MKKLTGLLLSFALLTGVLAGCGAAPAETSPGDKPESTPAAAETGKPEAGGEKEETAGRQNTDESTDGGA
ncbi:hypothetical protein AALB39_11320 [Lachnospiraceae bacterium 54-53]